MRLRSTRQLLILVAVPALAACVADGRYVIRGTVRSEAPDGSSRPVAGATVVAVSAGGGGGSDPVVTGADGTYALEYWFGGVVLAPFMSAGDRNPELRFSAPGYRPLRASLASRSAEPGVVRRSCDPSRCRATSEDSCCGVDVVLAPDPAGAAP